MQKINKFYVLLSVLLLVLVGILVLSIRAVITSYMTSIELEEGEALVTVDRQLLNEVYNWSFDREDVSLNIESVETPEETETDEETN